MEHSILLDAVQQRGEEAKKMKLENILRGLKWVSFPVSADTCLCL